MAEVRTLALDAGWLDIVKPILQRHLPDRPVFAFGSRTRGRAQRRSDLDLAVGGPEPLTISVLTDVKEDFSESDLPILVDILDMNSVDAGFLERIKPHLVLVQPGESRS